MTFAIITPALVIGAYVERMKFAAVLIFSTLWLLFVYAPVTHWVWGGGIMAGWGVMDFAGGIVVHATAGTAALVCAVMVGRRRSFPQSVSPPHSPGLTMIGAAMLWVGWFGFNGGSALGANGGAGMALLVTHIAAATASLVWMGVEWLRFGRPSLVGIVTGMVAGLATVTPASGFIGVPGGLILGLAGGFGCYFAVDMIRGRLKIDDLARRLRRPRRRRHHRQPACRLPRPAQLRRPRPCRRRHRRRAVRGAVQVGRHHRRLDPWLSSARSS